MTHLSHTTQAITFAFHNASARSVSHAKPSTPWHAPCKSFPNDPPQPSHTMSRRLESEDRAPQARRSEDAAFQRGTATDVQRPRIADLRRQARCAQAQSNGQRRSSRRRSGRVRRPTHKEHIMVEPPPPIAVAQQAPRCREARRRHTAKASVSWPFTIPTSQTSPRERLKPKGARQTGVSSGSMRSTQARPEGTRPTPPFPHVRLSCSNPTANDPAVRPTLAGCRDHYHQLPHGVRRFHHA
jgi:hypothetical protein